MCAAVSNVETNSLNVLLLCIKIKKLDSRFAQLRKSIKKVSIRLVEAQSAIFYKIYKAVWYCKKKKNQHKQFLVYSNTKFWSERIQKSWWFFKIFSFVFTYLEGVIVLRFRAHTQHFSHKLAKQWQFFAKIDHF